MATEKINLAQNISKAYPGVYVFGSLRRDGWVDSKKNYVRFYTDPAKPHETNPTYWQY